MKYDAFIQRELLTVVLLSVMKFCVNIELELLK